MAAEIYDAENCVITHDGDKVVIEMNIGGTGRQTEKTFVKSSLKAGLVLINSKGESIKVQGNAYVVNRREAKTAPVKRVY